MQKPLFSKSFVGVDNFDCKITKNLFNHYVEANAAEKMENEILATCLNILNLKPFGAFGRTF